MINRVISAPVETTYTAAANMPILDGIIGTKVGLLDTAIATKQGLLNGVIDGKLGLLDAVVGDRGLLSGSVDLVTNTFPTLSGGLLNGGILNGGLLNGTFLNGGLLNGGILFPNTELQRIQSDIPMIRGLLAQAFMNITAIPTEAVNNFLEILEVVTNHVPSATTVNDDIRSYATQRSIVDLYGTLETEKLNQFRSTLGTMRGMLPATQEGGFMERFNLGLLDGIRSELFDGILNVENYSTLRAPAQTYLNQVFPNVGVFAETDNYMQDLSGKLGGVFGLESYPMDGLSRILSYKMDMVNTAAQIALGVVSPLVDIGTGVVELGMDLSTDVLALLPVLPGIAVDVIFELLALTRSIAEGVIDTKLAALEFIARLKIEVIATILEIPLSIFSSIKLAEVGILRGLFEQVQGMLGVYGDYTGMLGLNTQVFPLSQFADLSMGILNGGATFTY